jgi:hypothetical protein
MVINNSYARDAISNTLVFAAHSHAPMQSLDDAAPPSTGAKLALRSDSTHDNPCDRDHNTGRRGRDKSCATLERARTKQMN